VQHGVQAAGSAADQVSLGGLVRAHRRRLQLTQEEPAERAGLSERTLRNLEGDRIHRPYPDTIRRLVDALQDMSQAIWSTSHLNWTNQRAQVLVVRPGRQAGSSMAGDVAAPPRGLVLLGAPAPHPRTQRPSSHRVAACTTGSAGEP
jgi:DNA-binding XRE family transcriptional regulator